VEGVSGMLILWQSTLIKLPASAEFMLYFRGVFGSTSCDCNNCCCFDHPNVYAFTSHDISRSLRIVSDTLAMWIWMGLIAVLLKRRRLRLLYYPKYHLACWVVPYVDSKMHRLSRHTLALIALHLKSLQCTEIMARAF